MYQKYIKRWLDIILSFSAIIILGPLMVLVAILIRINLGKPVIFSQYRPGKNEKIFKMYKFRSMTDEKDKNGHLLSDDKRLTAFGKWLRSTSLDELPELFNILKGDMSIVGPRPQLVRDMVFMTDNQRKRHQVLPGLTGLAQINGRNNILWSDKFKLDLQYVNHISFAQDIKIVLKTVIKVLKKKDVSMTGFETSEDLGDFLLRQGLITYEEYTEKIKKSEKILGLK